MAEEKGREEAVTQVLDEYPSHIVNILFGYRKSQMLFIANDLGLFDVCTERITASNVAKVKALDPGRTERFLDMLASLNLLTKELQGEESVYCNTADSQANLTSGSPRSMKAFIQHHQVFSWVMPQIADSLKYGGSEGLMGRHDFYLKDAIAEQHGLSKEEHEKIKIHGNQWRLSVAADALAAAFDLSHFKTACDVGGGTGGLSFKIAKRYPDIRIEILEHPSTIELMKKHRPSWVGCEANRVTYQPVDFMKEDIPPADLYIMGHINNMFSDNDVLKLWKKIFNSLHSGGAFLVCERLLDDDRAGPSLVSLSDMALLLYPSLQGRERSAMEYKQFLEVSGFTKIDVKKFHKYIGYSVIYGTKP